MEDRCPDRFSELSLQRTLKSDSRQTTQPRHPAQRPSPDDPAQTWIAQSPVGPMIGRIRRAWGRDAAVAGQPWPSPAPAGLACGGSDEILRHRFYR